MVQPPELETTTATTMFSDDIDNESTCSTPYVSAPSSPGRGGPPPPPPISGFYYSAPASPMHFILSTAASKTMNSLTAEVSPASSTTCSFEFDFSTRLAATTNNNNNGTASVPGSMSSADELFLNGQIRPMKLSTHLQRPQVLAPLLDLEEEEPDDNQVSVRGRRPDSKLLDRSLRRRTRSMSPLRNFSFEWGDEEVNNKSHEENVNVNGTNDDEEEEEMVETTRACESGASSRSSSVGRSSKRWVFLKEFLYRSKSEGRNNGNKFWGSLSFSPVKDKIKISATSESIGVSISKGKQSGGGGGGKEVKKKRALNGVGKRRVPPSPHELHYTANRAQAEEMRKKTFLPYRQGLLGCLGFSSKSYGAINGFARALNPVSSR